MIPYIISNNPQVYVSQSTITNHRNGVGRLTECISCKVHETLEGEKTATLRVPTVALHADKLVRGGLLMFDDSEHINQLWRIESISKTFADGYMEINCNHISYDLKKLACRPFSATGLTNILDALRTNYISYMPFTFLTSIINQNVVVGIDVPTYYREIIGGIEGNIIEKLDCEVNWDNLNVNFVNRRGRTRNVSIRYGVNIINARQEESLSEVYDIIYGYVKKGDDPVVIGNPYFVGTLPNYPKTKVVDLTSTFAEGDTINATTVRDHTATWASENDVFTPKINFSVDYANLQAVDADRYGPFYIIQLGDTVKVIIPNFGKYTARVREVTYDVLANRLDSIVVGNYNNSLADTVAAIKKDSATLKAYPVGSYYSSSENTNPSAIFGGQWTRTSASGGVYTFRRTA